MRNRTVTAVLNAPQPKVFEYMSAAENLPQWATEFARELRRDEDGYVVVNNRGEFRFEIRADAETGVIDMFAGPGPDQMAVFPCRVVSLGDDTCAFSFTMFQGPGMDDELFNEQYESLCREVAIIEARFG
jgi:hypothetical protein